LGLTEAYRIHYPERCLTKAGKERLARNVSDAAKEKWGSDKIQAYVRYLNLPASEVLDRVESQLLHTGSLEQRAKAADRIRARQEVELQKSGHERWAEMMLQSDAIITAPVPPMARTVEVRLEDVMEGRARMRLPFEGMLKLLRMAGAPWNDKDPKADVSPLQIEMLKRKEKIVVLEGGTGCGKSVLGAERALAELALPNKRIGILGATYDHAGSEFQYLYEGFLKLFGPSCASRITYKNHKTHQDMEIQTIWNSMCRAHSLDRDGGAQMYGKEFDLVIMAESSRINADAWWRAVYRGLQRRAMRMKLCDCDECENPDHYWTPETGYALFATTPDGYEGASHSVVEHVEEITKQAPHKVHYENTTFQNSFYIRNADCLENPSYDPEAFQAAVDHLPEDVVDEQYRGLARARSGLIYQEFNRFKHLKEMPTAEELMQMRFGVGGDTAKHAAFHLLGIQSDNTKWILGEVFNIAATTRENGHAIMEMIVRFFAEHVNLKFDVDGASDEDIKEMFEFVLDRVEIWNFDQACQSKEDFLEVLEAPIMFEKPELMGSIDLIRTWFKSDALYIATVDNEPVAPNYVWELNKHKWRVVRPTASGSVRPQLQPEQKNNHSCDAVRYGLTELHKAGPVITDDREPLTLEEAYKNAFEKPLLDWKNAQLHAPDLGTVVRSLLN
jgi:hypothetical protein